MRLNRKWLYLGGLVTILTLLLTLTLALPAGAVGTLDEGSLSTDVDYVSPDTKKLPTPTDINDPHPRAVKVTLSNVDLDSTMSVGIDGDFEAVKLTFPDDVDPLSVSAIRLNIVGIPGDGATPGRGFGEPSDSVLVTLPTKPDGTNLPDDADSDPDYVPAVKLLPIIGDVTIDTSRGGTLAATARKVGTPVVINASTGLIEIPVIARLLDATDDDGDGTVADEIYLSYNTSLQQTALVNIQGDTANFDLLTLEETGAPGDHTASFVVAEPSAVTMNNDSVVQEQHEIETGLRGYIEVENERIDQFYGDYDRTTGGLTVGDYEDDLAGGILTDGADVAGLENGDVFYARVANPPIRDGRDAEAPNDDPEVTYPNDIRHDDTNLEVALVDAEQGVLSFTVDSDSAPFGGFPGGDFEVDYFGSDSFSFVVDHGPIQVDWNGDGEVDETDDLLSAVNLGGPTGNADGIQITLPTPDGDTIINADNMFKLISIEDDGTNCVRCVVRLGVNTGPDKRDDPVALKSRFSVLGISYSGSERVRIDNGLDFVADSEPDEKRYSVFSRVLASAPVYDEDDVGNETDIRPIGVSGQLIDVNGTPTPIGLTDSNISVALDDGAQRVNGRTVYFRLDRSALLETDLDADTTGDQLATTLHYTFDITYTRQVGAVPENALNPKEKVRPIVAVAAGSRARITSANDATTVDAEGDGPRFENAIPAHNAGSANTDQMISIDVLDDLSGVKENSILLYVKAANSATNDVLNKDLTITEIIGGFNVTIALDDVRDGGAGDTLNLGTDKETEVNWYVTAKDNAGNSSSSDSNSKKSGMDGADAPPAMPDYDSCHKTAGASYDCYTFTVDGQRPTFQRAYTGDWFNVVAGEDGQVEGDRRLSQDNYLPGKSRATSIRVVFNEVVDGETVSADDFTVDGDAPSGATWYSAGSTDGGGDDGEDTTNGVIGRSVFLTVPAMAADATPTVAIVGSVSDRASNAIATGSKVAIDGIAPTATLSVDERLSQKSVVVTVETDESIRTLAPTLELYVSNAVDRGNNPELDEKDTFTVGYEDPDGSKDTDINPLVLRNGKGDVVFSGELTGAGDLPLTLGSPPILNRSQDPEGVINGLDIEVSLVYAKPGLTTGPKVKEDAISETVVDAKGGAINLRIVGRITGVPADPEGDPAVEGVTPVLPLASGDKISVSYRGTDPDPANQFSTVPTNPVGKQLSSSNVWNFAMDITRADRFAVRALVEDSNRNQGIGGVQDPTDGNATVFEIDNKLANGGIVRTIPSHDSAGNNPASETNPFYIELYWDGSEDETDPTSLTAAHEGKEYPGDSSKIVTLTAGVLDGTDVLDMAVRQTAGSWRIGIPDIGLGEHTLKYNAEDALGNTYPADRTVIFTVQEVPTWDLRLTAGMNLVSLPADPANGDVNELFGDVEAIDLIFTFEGSQSKVALRNPDEPTKFVGTLDRIDGQHAYWVSTKNAATVPISIPPTSQLGAPALHHRCRGPMEPVARHEFGRCGRRHQGDRRGTRDASRRRRLLG